MPELKNRQWELFARAYIATYGNARQSAIDAGYSVGNARKQGSVLASNPAVRARVAELAAEIDAPGIAEMERARAILYSRLETILQSSSSDMAAVQAGRVLGDLLGMGESGERVKAQQDKIALERDKIALQRDMLKAAKDDKNVRIIIDPQLNSAVQREDKGKNA
jgi:phage terminase small subunit|nr:MAG TPA: Terminase small subunit [Caudoviricetes sp.]